MDAPISSSPSSPSATAPACSPNGISLAVLAAASNTSSSDQSGGSSSSSAASNVAADILTSNSESTGPAGPAGSAGSAGPQPIARGRVGYLWDSSKSFIGAAFLIAAFAAIVFATIAFVMGGVFGIAGGVALLIGAGASFCIAGHLLSDPSPSLSRNDMAYFSPEQIAQQRHLQELRKAQIEAFNKTLAEQGLEVKECGGGGDCLFHSLYYHFGRMAKLKDHKAVREKVVAHMESHPDDFKSYVEHSEFKQIEKLESRDGHDLNLDKYKAYFDFMMKKGLLTNTQKRTFQQKIDDSTSSVKAVTDEDVLDIRLKAYIALMNRTGEWGGEQEVKAFASYLAEHGHLIRIVVHSPENNGYLTCYPPGTERNTEYHLLRNGNHWQALVPKKSS